MQLETFTYTQAAQWSVNPFPSLDSPQTLVIVFAGSGFIENPAAIQALAQAYPTSHLIGCSTSGEIFGGQLQDDSLSVAVVKFDATQVRHVTLPITPSDGAASLSEALLQSLQGDDLRGILLLASSLDFNFAELVGMLTQQLQPDVTITGGIAGDGDRFQRTWIIKDGMPIESHISAIGLYGNAINIAFGSQGGWQVKGMPMMITRSEKNILYELDGYPALRMYKVFLLEQSAKLPSATLRFPLAIRRWAGDPEYLVRTVLAVNEQDQSMIFASDMPSRYIAQFMRASVPDLVAGATQAARMTEPQQTAEHEPMLSIAISCVGRRLVLMNDTEKELQAVLEVLPPGVRQVGYYSYGEICPMRKGGFSDLHNQTMTLTTISEKPG